MQVLTKYAHGGLQPCAAKPAQHFLCAVSEKDHSQNNPRDRKRPISIRSNQPRKHFQMPPPI
jgi:hypothetical protein